MRILVTGASGQLGSYLLKELSERRANVTAWNREHTGELFGFRLKQVDLSDQKSTTEAFFEASPEAVIHLAGQTKVKDCFENVEAARRINVDATELIAKLSESSSARLIFTSTDMVFNGERGNYCEDEPTSPLSSYGRSKSDAERFVGDYKSGLVARMSLMYGVTQSNRPMFFDTLAAKLRAGETSYLFEDEWRTPLDLLTAARLLLSLIETSETGVMHLGGTERMNRFQMGQRLAKHLGCSQSLIQPMLSASAQHTEPRPEDLSLNIDRLRAALPNFVFPSYDEALHQVC